jgi:hypothetical protein
MDQWQELKVALHQESEAIFHSSGDVVLVESSAESNSVIALISRTKHLKLVCVPEPNAVKWETAKEYGFEPMSESTSRLATTLMQRVHRL